MSSTRKTSSRKKLFSFGEESELLAILGALVIPIVAYFVLPAIPGKARAPVGLGFATLLVLVVVLFIGSRLRELRSVVDSNQSAIDLLLSERSQNDIAGIIHKGAIRNVSLRATTIHRIVNCLISEVPDASREHALREAGRLVGHHWGRSFLDECRRTRIDTKHLDDKLSLWSDYDATAGMGRFRFSLSDTGHGTVSLTDGFLSDEDAIFPLDFLVAGYLEGTLQVILERSVQVQLVNPATDTHSETIFYVDLAKQSAEPVEAG
ncbi:MAG: hypothetical protein ACYDGY_04185 [Acidimicrobiales bacterium]